LNLCPTRQISNVAGWRVDGPAIWGGAIINKLIVEKIFADRIIFG